MQNLVCDAPQHNADEIERRMELIMEQKGREVFERDQSKRNCTL
jgi:hypothetical protein